MTLNLVTGADGFVGQHLVAELLGRGEGVVGAVRWLPPELTTLPDDLAAQVRWVPFDLERRESVRALVRDLRVDRVFHLAALSSVADSLDDAVPPMQINVLGTLFLLEELTAVLRAEDSAPTVLISGSSQVYGSAAARYSPLREEHPLEPLSPYAVSKAAQELLGLQFQRADGLPVIVTRSFNHTGPGQRPAFVAAQLARQVAAIRAAGGTGVVRVGNVDVRRDFTDVRDVVKAYVALGERGEPGRVYNVCSGRSYAVGGLLEILAHLAGVEVRVERDPGLSRRVDIPEMLGSNDRLVEATGWAPEIEIRQSLADLLAAQDVP